MLYPKNLSREISLELFKHPTAEYRAAPFWAWNTKLDKSLLNSEIDCMKEMGFGGFHMHTRVGMATRYLSDEFMGFIRSCVEKAKDCDMLAWLYDEDKWPSGYGGGYVTENHENRQKYILFTATPYNSEGEQENVNDASAKVSRNGKGELLARYDVQLDGQGYLLSYKMLQENQEPLGEVWYAYMETAASSPWFNNQAYVDTLSKKAVKCFIDTTHEAYKKAVGDSFGGDIPAIFTDEPQFTYKGTFKFAADKSDVTIPYTSDFDQTYYERYGERFLPFLPEVFWDKKQGVSVVRYRYHDHIAERFVSAFADQVGGWCKQNGIMLTGHVMNEPTLLSQTSSVGDAMRSYRSFTLPGVDMLCDDRELTTVKQAASAAHQYGYPGVLSECYGVTNWNFDFRGHKLQGDWQAALGVSVRVPHLYWVAMGGEAKRDYPASIGHQSPWYKEYSYIEDHLARVGTVMTRGTADISIGVIHPVESYWLHFGPNQQTRLIRDDMERRFSETINWLIHNSLDFDYICESLLDSQFENTPKGFKVGKMTYDVIVVPYLETIRRTTLEKLETFARRGGKIIFMGGVPKLVDAAPSNRPTKLAKKCINIPWSQNDLLLALEDNRTISIQDLSSGAAADNLLYGMRKDGGGKNLFVAHINSRNRDVTRKESYKIRVKGVFAPYILDTFTGEKYPVNAVVSDGFTEFIWECYAQSSLLVRLEDGAPLSVNEDIILNQISDIRVDSRVRYSLSEPNVYMLDMANWAIDDGEWQPKEETLKICDKAKTQLGFSLAGAGGCQPWIYGEPPATTHKLRLKYIINSNSMVEDAFLALENLNATEIVFNGKKIDSISCGKYVDVDIDRVALPIIRRGENELILTVDFGELTCIENSFILGEFAVNVEGSEQTIEELPSTICFGDITSQGFPFYGGNITYRFMVMGDGTSKTLKLDLFEAPVITVSCDQQRLGVIAISPYEIDLGMLSKGLHTVNATAYGSRINTFGALHNCDNTDRWYGPTYWRSTGGAFSYEYRLKPCGILTTPRIITKE